MLGSRLLALAKQISLGDRVADIGTDHGLIPVYLAKKGISNRVIATDVSVESLQKARDLVKKESLENIIETRVGFGLQVITPGEIDTIIIAGLGGILIRAILEEGIHVLKSASKVILQPMNNQKLVRRWLVAQGFAFRDEVLVKEGKYLYEILIAGQGHQEVAHDIQYEIGFKFIENRDPLYKEFIAAKVSKTKNIINRLRGQNTKHSREAMERFRAKLEHYIDNQ